jgi:ribosome-associated protein
MTDEEPLSKTQRKEQMHALQDLGARLVALDEQRLAALDLPEDLLIAVREAKRLRAHEARRRQMQYIGKVMRRLELGYLEERLASLGAEAGREVAAFHRVERWRERLIGDDAALDALLKEQPQADGQRVRALVRNARKEQAQGAAPKSSRALFRLLRDLLDHESGAQTPKE